jgi:hypothetical protein
MLASSIPAKFNISFGNNAVPTNINPIPQASQIGITTGAASLVDGFPPVTFIPVGAGGTPPWGRDFNGLFNQITAWTQFADCAGGLPLFDATFSSAIGGYPKGALIAAISGVTTGSPQGGAHLWLSTVDNNTVNPDTVFNTANWIPIPAIIDTAITMTVHGAGAQFADLNAATAWLLKYSITHNGSVVLQLAGASSGVATQYTYTSSIIFDHPNNNRIFIYGATMLAPLPVTDAGLSVTGNTSGQRASDLAANLTILRSKFATELYIVGTNSSGAFFQVKGRSLGALDAILITSDASGSTHGFQFTCSGDYINGSRSSGLASVGFSGIGFIIDLRGVIGTYTTNANTASIICCGCTVGGFSLANGAEFTSAGPILTAGNGNYGILCNPGSNAQFDGNVNSSGNGTHGIQTALGCFYTSGANINHVWLNGQWGIATQYSPPSVFVGDLGSGHPNSAGPVIATNGTTITITGSTNIPPTSPPVNTNGNGNSMVVL